MWWIVAIVGMCILADSYSKKKDHDLKIKQMELEQKKLELELKKAKKQNVIELVEVTPEEEK